MRAKSSRTSSKNPLEIIFPASTAKFPSLSGFQFCQDGHLSPWDGLLLQTVIQVARFIDVALVIQSPGNGALDAVKGLIGGSQFQNIELSLH
jgi:hypothetical protein